MNIQLNFSRDIQKYFKMWLFKNKVIMLYGPRRSGKTYLSKEILKIHSSENSYFNCEDLNIRQVLERRDLKEMKNFFGEHRIIVLDEAQYIPEIGQALKLFHDTYPETQIIATGSSSFELSNQTGEPLTGRSIQFLLLPISILEVSNTMNRFELKGNLELFMRFGMYPEVLTGSGEAFATDYLNNLVSQYLYKDILIFEQVKKSDMLIKLLQLLAFQIGSEVSFHELATKLKINTRTVERYIDLLEKTFVIYRLKAFSRNLRKEISKKEKIYFIDLGIRNALINNFNPLTLRTDTGALWENFCMIERRKLNLYAPNKPFMYFWRTNDKKEVDLIEEEGGKLKAFEFKWKETKYKIPKDFIETYETPVSVINEMNFMEFLL